VIVRVPCAEGTLAIDLRDPSTSSLVWRAIARDEQRDPIKLQDRLDDMVRKRSISILSNPRSHAAVSAQPNYPACLEVRPWSFWSASSAASWLE
jgi:hypothetical protein